MASQLIYSTEPEDLGYTDEYMKESYEDWDDMTDEQKSDILYMNLDDDFESFKSDLKRFMDDAGVPFLLSGRFMRWDGAYRGGSIVFDEDEVCARFNGTVQVCDEDGHFKVYMWDHDNPVTPTVLELRPLTAKGVNRYEHLGDWMSEVDKAQRIDGIKCYTKNANYPRIVWGA